MLASQAGQSLIQQAPIVFLWYSICECEEPRLPLISSSCCEPRCLHCVVIRRLMAQCALQQAELLYRSISALAGSPANQEHDWLLPSKQASKQANKQASKQASKQAASHFHCQCQQDGCCTKPQQRRLGLDVCTRQLGCSTPGHAGCICSLPASIGSWSMLLQRSSSDKAGSSGV